MVVWSGDYLRHVIVDVKCSQDKNETGEGGVRGDGSQPVIIEVEESHLGLSSLEDEVSELLHLQASLEG